MKYFYQNAMNPRKYFKCIRTAKEWVNQDLPNVYRLDGTRAIEVTFPDYKILVYADDKKEAKQLESFVIRSTGKMPEVYF